MPDRRLLDIGAVKNDGGADLMATAEDAEDLGSKIDAYGDGSRRHILVVPDEVAIVHASVNF